MLKNRNISDLIDQHGNLTFSAMEAYIRGELNADELAVINDFLENSPFEKDALEGFRDKPEEFSKALFDEMNHSIRHIVDGKVSAIKVRNIRRLDYAAAASLAGIICIALIMFFTTRKPLVYQQLALIQMDTVVKENILVKPQVPVPAAIITNNIEEVKPPKPIKPDQIMIVEDHVEIDDNITGILDEENESVVPVEETVEQETAIFMVVEQMPEYPGGDSALFKFLSDNISYPETAREQGIQGRVFTTFVIEMDGSVKDVRILRGIGGGCDEEAIRVIQMMPGWIPGKQRGKPVRVQCNLPIKFSIE